MCSDKKSAASTVFPDGSRTLARQWAPGLVSIVTLPYRTMSTVSDAGDDLGVPEAIAAPWPPPNGSEGATEGRVASLVEQPATNAVNSRNDRIA